VTLRHTRIHSQQGNSFNLRLSHKDAIKWILVNRRQTLKSNCVLTANGQLAVAIIKQSAAKQTCIDFEVGAA
jgi:hypothetical protein